MNADSLAALTEWDRTGFAFDVMMGPMQIDSMIFVDALPDIGAWEHIETRSYDGYIVQWWCIRDIGGNEEVYTVTSLPKNAGEFKVTKRVSEKACIEKKKKSRR